MLPEPAPEDRPVRDRDRLRILVVAETYPPDVNGSSQFSHRLAQAVARRGHDVHIAAPRPGRGPTVRRMDGLVTEHRFRSHTAFTYDTFNFCFPWEIRGEVARLMDELQPDVVHIECHYILGRYFAKEAQSRGIRLIGTNHFIPENIEQYLPLPNPIRRLYRRISWRDMAAVFRRCDVVTAPTPLAVESMREHGFDFPMHPLSNGIDAAQYEPRPGEELPRRQRPTVLFTGRLDPEKHIDVLLRAVASIADRSDVGVEVVGQGGEFDRLHDLSQELGIGERVEFRGYITDEQLRVAYLRADVFCQPGTAELQSLVTLEAMSASTPVLLADARALPHLVEEGVNGWLFPPGDHAELGRLLLRMLELPEQQRRAMGAASRRMVERHSFAATIDAFEQMYLGADPRQLLAEWPRRPQTPLE
ncbi:glycosyltransferase [Kocuria palustris]|uniref:glycosyltransferase n=1 Tax=Kocuria palustris TaxID=71999 RepID=UPI0011A60583|nr:glycosyltransferase [Kocuria palustris]